MIRSLDLVGDFLKRDQEFYLDWLDVLYASMEVIISQLFLSRQIWSLDDLK